MGECVLKIVAEGFGASLRLMCRLAPPSPPARSLLGHPTDPQNYFADSWNCFDFVIVIVGLVMLLVGGANVSLARILRLLRVFKLATSLPKLQVIIEAFLQGLSSVG